MSSPSDLNGEPGATLMTKGYEVRSDTMAMSFSGSNGNAFIITADTG